MKRGAVGVSARLPLGRLAPLGLQHLFAMFGATILVPVLTGLNPAVALFSSGAGTLLFIAITGGKVPAYLGSSFAFIAPLTFVVTADQWGIPYAMGGVVAVGVIYAVVAGFVATAGVGWLQKAVPPIVIGPVIMVIGLGLAPAALGMTGLTEPGAGIADGGVQVALITLALAVVATLVLKGWLSTVPVLLAIAGGYVAALLLGLVDFEPVRQAAWIGLPAFTAPKFSLGAIFVLAPVALVTLAEHLGDVFVLSRVVGDDFYVKPGLHKTLLGDGLATALAGFVGGPPNTTYGENVGVMAITGVYSVRVIAFAAVSAVVLSFVPKVGAVIQTVPPQVMGGIAMVLYGVIAASGIRTLIESRVDLGDKRNLIIASVILVIGIGGATVTVGPFELQGMALATLVGVILNLVLPPSADESEGRQEGAPVKAPAEG